MSRDVSRPPVLRLDETTVVAAHVLDDGVWVPRVIVPILRGRRADGGVVYGIDGREWIYRPPAPDPETGEADWSRAREAYSPYTAVGGVIRQVHVATISTTATTLHQCGPCGAEGPWAAEWVTGAIHHTSRLECRTCWQAETRAWYLDWVQELIRRIAPTDFAEGSSVDLGRY